MNNKIIVILALLLASPLHAEEMERSTITACGYQAGTAREIQTVRQNEGDVWSEFEQKVKKIYKDGQGRSDLLIIAEKVYQQPKETSATDVYGQIFEACVRRIQDTEESA